MFFSFVLLRRTYAIKQIGAVLIILFGLLIATYSSMSKKVNYSSTCDFFWNILFLVASIPISLATVYQEKAFAEQPIRISYMLAWSTFYQMIGILLAAPVDAIPGFGNSKDFATIFTNQLDALKCFAQHQETSPLPSCPNCDCQGAWVYILLFVLFYTASSFFLVGVVKYGNATFFFIVNTFVIPLTEFAFGCPFLMGKYVESISLFNCMSLVILLIGIVIYRLFDPKLRKGSKAIANRYRDYDCCHCFSFCYDFHFF